MKNTLQLLEYSINLFRDPQLIKKLGESARKKLKNFPEANSARGSEPFSRSSSKNAILFPKIDLSPDLFSRTLEDFLKCRL